MYLQSCMCFTSRSLVVSHSSGAPARMQIKCYLRASLIPRLHCVWIFFTCVRADSGGGGRCKIGMSETSFRQCAIVFALNEWFSPQSVKTRELYQFQAWNADLELEIRHKHLSQKCVCASQPEMQYFSKQLRVRAEFCGRNCYCSNYFMQLYFCRWLECVSHVLFFRGRCYVGWKWKFKIMCSTDNQKHLIKRAFLWVLWPKIIAKLSDFNLKF